MSTMAYLVLRRHILEGIKRTVFRTMNETGVRLIGEARGGRYIVRHLIGPGERAVRKAHHYECDNEYAEDRFNELLKTEPHLTLLGELHTHPAGEPELSRRDLATIREVQKELPVFIAGTIQRRPFTISPYLFSRGKRIRLSCVLR